MCTSEWLGLDVSGMHMKNLLRYLWYWSFERTPKMLTSCEEHWRRHINPDWSLGGWIGTNVILKDTFVPYHSVVMGVCHMDTVLLPDYIIFHHISLMHAKIHIPPDHATLFYCGLVCPFPKLGTAHIKLHDADARITAGWMDIP